MCRIAPLIVCPTHYPYPMIPAGVMTAKGKPDVIMRSVVERGGESDRACCENFLVQDYPRSREGQLVWEEEQVKSAPERFTLLYSFTCSPSRAEHITSHIYPTAFPPLAAANRPTRSRGERSADISACAASKSLC